MTDYFISGDIGGTKTLLQAAELKAGGVQVYCEHRYASREYASFSDVLTDFMERAAPVPMVGKTPEPVAACFAVAGPIEQGKVSLTNLRWVMDSAAIAKEFSIPAVKLINDFAAVALSIETLSARDLVTLQPGELHPGEMRVALGAGTGMGVAWLIWQGDRYVTSASEAGHMDFAAADELQDRLLKYLRGQLGHVSVERVLSGPGLTNIFNFLQANQEDRGEDREADARSNQGGDRNNVAERIQLNMEEDGAAQVADLAFNHNHSTALKAMDLFVEIYGAYAGNLALTGLSRGGVYVAGGIAPKIINKLREGGFVKAFRNKGRFAPLMEEIPVHVVTNPKAGLLGAAREAQRMLHEKSSRTHY
ncbi:glucokinase [Nitrosovibrio tenuis]|uniref:Glucokinase n=1 Tax=Nitrosovibrio tenuis TaxID=1233 RepID=A0A1H7MKF9_9PROT|nr:glucokinase [Nitrosovibrio tenuis]SEL11175.1 glucokinase [Nitrosovibrio tenuis]